MNRYFTNLSCNGNLFNTGKIDNLYLLPSSIHEWIIVLEQEGFDEETLKDMVCEVNHTQVACDEVLSNQVYFYNKDTNRIESKEKAEMPVYG